MKLISNWIWSVILLIIILCFACKKNGTEPEPGPEEIPLDGRGGGVIAFCYQPVEGDETQKEIYALNADGSGNIRMINTQVSLNYPVWSPDAQKFVVVGYVDETTWSIYIFDSDGGHPTRLTSTRDVWDNAPAWSHDGLQIAFTRFYPSQNREEIWIMNADGTNPHWIGIEGGSARWSPVGTRLIYHSLKDPDGDYDVYTCNTQGGDEQQLTTTPSGEITPVWSPDGSQIVFTRVGDDLRHEICIMNSDGSDLQSVTDGGAPKWSPDASLIAFHSNDEIYIIQIDGTNRRRVTNSPDGITAINPDWKPVQ